MSSPKLARIVCVSGIDGSGKSMLIDAMVKDAEARGEKVDVQWLRFNHFYVKPLLAVGRLLGMTVYEEVQGHRLGYHRFGKSALARRAYYWLQMLDAKRAARRYLGSEARSRFDLIVLDRFAFDIAVDMSVATGDPEFLGTAVAKKLIALLPAGALVFGIQRDKQGILDCRPESALDRDFEPRLAQYERIYQRDDVLVLHNNGTPADLLEAASSAFKRL